VTQTPTVQTNKTISTVLPSLTQQQLNQFQVQQQQIHMQQQQQQQNTVQSYNTAPMRVCLKINLVECEKSQIVISFHYFIPVKSRYTLYIVSDKFS
jgi:hypothetical protein